MNMLYLTRPIYSMHVCNMYMSTCDKTSCEDLKIVIFFFDYIKKVNCLEDLHGIR